MFMYVCMYVSMSVCAHVFRYAYICVHLCVFIYVCVSVCVCVFVYTNVQEYVNISVVCV